MYSLTSEYGLKFIAACKQQGFHPHPKEPPIYEVSHDCQWPRRKNTRTHFGRAGKCVKSDSRNFSTLNYISERK